MSCIGTAGHVDHGKSTLVLALTGMDPDRLAEEKARGMTIDLGFAWLTLPSGREAGIVDVPGHESFIRNMLAGVGGIDVALLVVAADEGVMPQTDEHLAILDLLRVRAGVVALTKRDLVDDEWLELVREEVRERLAGTTLAGAPIIPCSATTRAGLDDLVAALDAALAAEPSHPSAGGGARLPVDRVFSMTGFGTVVTGTLLDGPLRLGQEVELLPRRLRARVRGLQSHKHAVELAQPGNRVAVNLAGVATRDLQRGDVLAAGARVAVTTAFDAEVAVLRAAPRPLTQQAEVSIYSGAAEVMARVTLLEGETIEPGATGWAQFRLRAPLVLARGDRFIARIPSPSLTIGGGAVIEPVARRHRRHDPAVLARLALLARADPREVVLAALEGAARPAGASAARRPGGYGGQTTSEIARRTGYQDADAAAVLAELEAAGAVVRVADWRFSAGQWQRLRAESARLLAEYHAQHPLRAGMPREEWRARLGCGLPLATEIVRALRLAGELREAPAVTATATADALLAAPDFSPDFTPAQHEAATRALALFHAHPYTPPARAEVEDLAGRDVTAALIERGDLVKISESVLLERAAYASASAAIVAYLRAHPTITVAEGRDLLGTTRKYMVALLEHLDERQITRRQGDDRVLGAKAPPA